VSLVQRLGVVSHHGRYGGSFSMTGMTLRHRDTPGATGANVATSTAATPRRLTAVKAAITQLATDRARCARTSRV